MQAQEAEPAALGSGGWSEKSAAAYLDGRLNWWMTWPASARDHETFCVSCHTVLPYAIARPALRTPLMESTPPPVEQKLIDNVTKRVLLWKEVAPFYPDETRGVPKTAESRGTESILNALILAGYSGGGAKSNAHAQLAFDNMWGQQLKTGEAAGAWDWLQFHNAPWEGDSQYYGATLAAIAVGKMPADYRSSPEIQPGLKSLKEYLVRAQQAQVLLNRVMLLWAAAKLPDLLTPVQRKALLQEMLSKQQPDGGFSLSSFVGDWKRRDNTPLETKSDGLATGIVSFVMQEAGISPDQAQLRLALIWLMKNQNQPEGRWLAYSLNKQRDLSTDVGKFMSDAATSYAVLSLERAK